MSAPVSAPNHRLTVVACYVANFLQATGAVFPILFVPLRDLYRLSYAQLGFLVSLGFVVQVLSDVLFSKPVERWGFRPFAVGSTVCSSLGLALFGASPWLFPGHEYAGFVIATALFSAAAGLQELLLSPIIDAVPMPDAQRAKAMSALHSLFAWGSIFVVLVTALMVHLLPKAFWPAIPFTWALIPLVNVYLFLRAPLAAKLAHGGPTRIAALLKNRVFWLCVLVIVFGGATEVTMAKWASAFIERGLSMNKLLGDAVGVCGFSLMLALGRTGYGVFGDRLSVRRVMLCGTLLAFAMYLLAAASGSPAVGLAACALAGLGASMLWPGSIIIAARQIPMAGASMFALLSAAGDVGAAAGSYLAGAVADAAQAAGVAAFFGAPMPPEQAALRYAILLASVYPVLCCAGILWLTAAIKRRG